MADVDGTYECVVKSPLGDQNMTLTVTADGATFFGAASGGLGSMDIGGPQPAGVETVDHRPDADDARLRGDGRGRHHDRLGRRGRVRQLPDDGQADLSATASPA